MADRLGDLADDGEPRVYGELGGTLGEVVVEPDLAGVVVEDEGWAEFVGGEALGAEDAWVVERFEQLKLAEGRPLERVAFLG
jgi:hypothetical protein